MGASLRGVNMEGYIKLHRKILDWEWWTDINTAHLFLTCLLLANHTTNKWQNIDVKRGEFITHYSDLSRLTGLTKSQVRTSLDKLIITRELEKISHEQSHEQSHSEQLNKKYLFIRVCNYKSYQQFVVDSTDDSTDDSTKIAQTVAPKSHSNRTPNNNDKNVNNNTSMYVSNYIRVRTREDEQNTNTVKLRKEM